MKRIFFIALLLVTHIVFGQERIKVEVSGTKCSLVPPEDFTLASNFSGFQHIQAGASIMINELPVSYQTIADGFTADALRTKGINLVSRKAIDLNNNKAILINATQVASGITYVKLILILGDDSHTVLVNGICPEDARDIQGKIKDALLSTEYNPLQDENPLGAASFTVDVANTNFKLVRYMAGALAYSVDGKMPTEKPTFFVGNSIAKVNTENREKFALDRLKSLPEGEKNVVKELSEVSIDNLDGYEIIADRRTSGNKQELLYQVMLFNNESDYYLVVGQSKENRKHYLKMFRKIAKTFKRKG